MAELNYTLFARSMDQLGGLAAEINVFISRFEELHKHVDSVNKAMETKFNNLNPQQQENEESLEIPPDITPETTSLQTRIAAEKVTALNAPEIVLTTTTEKDGKSFKPSELHYLCEMMSTWGLKKYVVSHFLEIQSSRQEAILALKSAPKPAKLVLEAVGRFFLQGIRAYNKDSPMITSRQASVLLLELFLAMIGESQRENEIEKPVKQEAENSAIAWKKRLVSEGGVCKACEIDCRGLLLFIACFGIPKGFKDDDLRDLMRCCNLKEIGHLLRGSCVLTSKIPDIIENMKKNGMHVEAVDVVYSFGIEDKFSPQKILYSFLRESKEAWQKTKQDAPVLQRKKADKKHLADLQSVIKCLEEKKIDPAKLLPGWQIKDKIIKLEKDISDLNKEKMETKMIPKRKAGEIESSNEWNHLEMKRYWFTGNGSTLTSTHDIGSHDPRASFYADRKSSYGLPPNLLDGSFNGYMNNHPSVSHVYNSGSLPDVHGATVGGRSNVNAVGVDVSMSPGLGNLPTGSNTSFHDGWHRDGDGANIDRIIGQGYTRKPADSAFESIYRPPLPYTERFAGLLGPSSIGSGTQNSSSDLYGFADSVI